MKKLLAGMLCALSLAMPVCAANGDGNDNDRNINNVTRNYDDYERFLQNGIQNAIEQGDLDTVRDLYNQGISVFGRQRQPLVLYSPIPYQWFSFWMNYYLSPNGNKGTAYEMINFLLVNDAPVDSIVRYYDFSANGKNFMRDFVLHPLSPFDQFSYDIKQKILASAFAIFFNGASATCRSNMRIRRYSHKCCEELEDILRYGVDRVRVDCNARDNSVSFTILNEEGRPIQSEIHINCHDDLYSIISRHIMNSRHNQTGCCTICSLKKCTPTSNFYLVILALLFFIF